MSGVWLTSKVDVELTNDLMNTGIRRYKEDHPAAAQWARGSRTVCHSEETQGRIFRMAEQLRAVWAWPSVGSLFTMLEALDDVVDGETSSTVRPAAISAARAGLVGYKMLFGELPPLQYHDWPEGFELIDEREAELATIGLRAQGFDPIVVDGIDPAAYLWACFEMRERRESCSEVRRLHEHAAMEPRGLAVIPQAVFRGTALPPKPATRRELVDVSR